MRSWKGGILRGDGGKDVYLLLWREGYIYVTCFDGGRTCAWLVGRGSCLSRCIVRFESS